jgi:hypothetical protein
MMARQPAQERIHSIVATVHTRSNSASDMGAMSFPVFVVGIVPKVDQMGRACVR